MTFAEKVAAALDTTDPNQAGDRVHRVVVDEIKTLDPSVEPVITGYFNHSYVPDLVVQWKDGTRRVERPVYLRHSLRSSRASGDLANLARMDKTGFYLSLSQAEPEAETQRARDVVTEVTEKSGQPRALVTTVPALAELTKPDNEADPVLGIVRASVVRSAKGFVDSDKVENLVLPRERRIESVDLQNFASAVTATFSEEAVVRINRVVDIVEQALSDEPTEIFGTGNLTEPEIRELVPYLLGLRGVTRRRDFWLSLARLITLEDLERQWHSFADLDLTPLAAAGSSIWRGTRAQLSIRSEAIDDDDFDLTPKWSISGRALSSEVGNWRMSYAFAGTKLKTTGREAIPAVWEDLKPALRPYRVTAVGLSGLVTQSTYGAQESADMKDRVDAFIASADDSFHIPSVRVDTGTGDDASSLLADFTEMLVVARPDASIETLTRVSLDILGYRYPTDDEAVEALLSGTPLPNDFDEYDEHDARGFGERDEDEDDGWDEDDDIILEPGDRDE